MNQPIHQTINLHRDVYLVDAATINDALFQAQKLLEKAPLAKSAEALIVIDMTCDFNQNKWLGQELADTLIYFNDDSKPNGLLAVLGCVKAPHSIFLASDQSALNDYFKCHILLPRLRKLCEYAMGVPRDVLIQSQKAPLKNLKKSVFYESVDNNALEKLKKATGVIHLIGERGSGKSTLLGKLLCETEKAPSANFPLLNEKGASNKSLNNLKKAPFEIYCVLTSPIPAASKNTFRAVEANEVSRETFTYCPPSEFLSAFKKAQLGIIDEAATLPKSLLTAAIAQAKSLGKKLILSTTAEGYEGTGQSYRLNYLLPNTNAETVTNTEADKCADSEQADTIIQLNNPKRFAETDPLYCLCQSLYNPSTRVNGNVTKVEKGAFQITTNITNTIQTAPLTFHVLNTKDLRDRGWTPACFALLRDAHYKTTPNDLARFYGDDALFALCLAGDELVAAAYGLPEELPENINPLSILYGERRVKNALTQQGLLHAYAELTVDNVVNKSLLDSRALRISRIATASAHRRSGLATQLLAHLSTGIVEMGYDFLSTSFSGSADNLGFWCSQGFTPARVGLQLNKANNEYAVLMLKGLSPNAQQLSTQSYALCTRHINYFSERYLPHYQCLLNSAPVLDTVLDDAVENSLNENINSVEHHHRHKDWLLPAMN